MKKLTYLMLIASIFLLFSCRSENFNQEETTQISTYSRSAITSKLINLSQLKNEVKGYNKITSVFIQQKFAKISNQKFSNKLLYRKVENNETKTITYTLPLSVYSANTPYYLIQQIVISEKGDEKIQYLKIIPNNPPLFKTQDVLPTLTGSIEMLDENLTLSHTTQYKDGKVDKDFVENKSGINSKSTSCVTFTELVAIPCSNGGNHGIGQSCDQGYTNDAHYEEFTYTYCFGGNDSGGSTSGGGGGSIGGGYDFDYTLNALLTNPTFQYADYLTDPSHNLLLQAVRQWIPTNITDIDGDLSALNQRIKLFVDNEQIFYDLETYNQNTPNVMNAEVTDYSVRVYEMFKFLMNYPTLENAAAAKYSVKILDLNRMISWENYFPIFKSLGKIMYDNPDSWEEIENSLQLNIKISNIALLKEALEDWKEPDRVKPTLKFKKHAKINAVYNKVKTAANFKQYLQNFEPTFSVSHLMFDIGACYFPTSLAETSWPTNYLIKITFNQDKDWTNIPKIVIADTFMHEMIHAEMFRKLLSLVPNSNGTLDENLIKQYVSTHNYPGLFDYYVRKTDGDESWQHQAMAAHYVNIMVNFLKQLYGTTYTITEYKTVVWMGLKGTKAWNLLPQSERTLYETTWSTNYWSWEL